MNDENKDPNLHREPIWEEVAEEMATFNYGHEFTWEWLEAKLKKSRDDKDFWRDEIEIRDFMKSKGKMLTRRDMKGKGYRIRHREEMPEIAMGEERAKLRRTQKTLHCLIATPTDGLPDGQIKAFDFVQRKLGLVCASVGKLLRMRKLPERTNPVNPNQIT
jgi:hypothetical protein